jgi:hypothetical protein
MEFEKLKPGMLFSLESYHERIFVIERITEKDIIFRGWHLEKGKLTSYTFPWDKTTYNNYKRLLKRLTSDKSREFIRIIFDESRPRRDWA